MTTWIFRRLIQAIFVVLAMTVIVFIGVNVIGDPVEILISPQADQAERARAVIALGLERWRPKLAERYTVPVSSGIIAGESLIGIAIKALARFGLLGA